MGSIPVWGQIFSLFHACVMLISSLIIFLDCYYFFVSSFIMILLRTILQQTKLLTSLTLLTNYSDITHTGEAKKNDNTTSYSPVPELSFLPAPFRG